MFGKTFKLPFTLLGIPVLLDITFLIILPLLAWLIGSNVNAYARFMTETGIEGNWELLTVGWMPYALGLIAAIGLFVSVVVHELGHAYRRGEPATNMPAWIPDQRDRILRPNDGRLNWQQNTTKNPSETFADMFIAWVYRAWNTSPGNSDLVSDAQIWMNQQIP